MLAMVNNMKKLVLTLLLLVPFLASAEGVADLSQLKTEYLFHLYYDNGTLYADRDYVIPYDIIFEEYIQPGMNTNLPFSGEVVNFKNEVVGSFKFNPRQDDPNLTRGKISVKAPYAPDAAKVIFYDSQSKSVLTISVEQSSYCNNDGICNADRGETSQTCSSDCRKTVPVSTGGDETSAPGSSNGLLSGIIYTAIGAIVLGGLWWWRRRMRNSLPTSLPPIS